MSGGAGRRDSRPAEPAGDLPEMVFEVRRADGPEGQRLAREQAIAIREVLEWIARRQSANGQAPAGQGD